MVEDRHTLAIEKVEILSSERLDYRCIPAREFVVVDSSLGRLPVLRQPKTSVSAQFDPVHHNWEERQTCSAPVGAELELIYKRF